MTQIRTISPARPDNIVMDWDRLRTEGLQHLEQLATGIWTDFNAHDPGITILEVLCYAITDLGYRTNFDIKDLVASPNKNEHPAKRDLFTPLDILTCLPVTPNDFRRILIDMEGVKNAWFYIAEEGLVADYRSEKEILQDLAAKLKKNERELTGLVDRIKDNYDISESETELVRLILRFYREYNYSFDLDPKDISFKGLYRIVLDLDDAIDTKNVLLVRQIKSAVLDKLHRYRSLCEDFAEVEVVRQKNIALCLEVEILPDVDPHQVEAEILFKIENYLAPEIRFYTLDQLLNEGIPCESIYSGPILDHGFIKESDLEASELRNVIYKSDLYHEIMSIGGVIGITNLKLGKCTNGCPHWEDKWCFTIFDKNEPPAKAVLDPCCTSIFLTIEGIDATTDAQEVQEQLSILQTQNAPLRGDGRDEKLHTPGNYNNWSEFTSIQHDFPEAYHVGDWGLPASATALRQAQVKQLKGFLLFFDQILANYMAQLAKVRDLLSVTQHPNEPTLFFRLWKASQVWKIYSLWMKYLY